MSFLRVLLLLLLGLPGLSRAVGAGPVAIQINHVPVRGARFLAKSGQTETLTVHISQAATDTLRCEYRLTGVDSRWTAFRHTTSMTYFQLPGGTYGLSIRSTPRGVLLRSVQITVEPLLWQKWWFLPSIYFFAFLVLASGLYFVYLYRLHQQVRLLAVRENIARDLHDDMGSYLGSISMLSQTVLNIAQKDPEHARRLVGKIGETARQVMESMSDIIWSVNPDNDSMAQIIVRMRDVATDMLGSQDIVLHQSIDAGVAHTHLPLEQRRDFFLIYKEALMNVAKYASASHVWVRLERTGATLRLVIQDDGIGFDPQQPVGRNPLGGNGLTNMRVRAEKTGGTVAIQSAAGQGTTLTVTIPVA